MSSRPDRKKKTRDLMSIPADQLPPGTVLISIVAVPDKQYVNVQPNITDLDQVYGVLQDAMRRIVTAKEQQAYERGQLAPVGATQSGIILPQ